MILDVLSAVGALLGFIWVALSATTAIWLRS